MKFSETQIGFEIPRILATSDVALRLLHTRYDHVTPLYPNTITKEDHVPTAVKHFKEEEHTEKAVTEDKVFAEENITNQAAESQSRQETELSFVQEEEPNTEALENIDVRKVGCCLSVCLRWYLVTHSRPDSPNLQQSPASASQVLRLLA